MIPIHYEWYHPGMVGQGERNMRSKLASVPASRLCPVWVPTMASLNGVLFKIGKPNKPLSPQVAFGHSNNNPKTMSLRKPNIWNPMVIPGKDCCVVLMSHGHLFVILLCNSFILKPSSWPRNPDPRNVNNSEQLQEDPQGDPCTLPVKSKQSKLRTPLRHTKQQCKLSTEAPEKALSIKLCSLQAEKSAPSSQIHVLSPMF